MRLIIITCPKLAADRLKQQISQFTRAIELSLLSRIEIICLDDLEARSLVRVPYVPEKWSNNITDGWEHFKQNILARVHKSDCSYERNLFTVAPNLVFPPRLLTQSEHSVALRHLLAVEVVANASEPCIILEDDALVQDESLFHELLLFMHDLIKPRLFVDLTDNYLPIDIKGLKSCQIGRIKYCAHPVALTRTLMAYAITPDTAKSLLGSLSHYSLPIDMQLQVQLCRLCLPGISLYVSPFLHGSKTDAIPSSIRQV